MTTRNLIKAIFTIPVLLSFLNLPAQSTDKNSNTVSLIYTHEISFGASLNTSGLSVFVNKTKTLNMNTKRFYQIELAGLNHPKEYKQRNDYVIGPNGYTPKPFVFGKKNSFLALHAGLGKKILLGDKAEKSGVEVNWVYMYGISLGLLKPYYLDLIYPVDGIRFEIRTEKYSAGNAQRFLNPQYIFGSSGFAPGLREIKLIPGIHAKTGLNFDWASYNDFVKSLEIGVTADVYYRKIPIMILEDNRPYFLAMYLSLQFGKKW